MSAMADYLIETVEGIMAARGIPASDTAAFDEIQDAVMAGTGYVCKACNGPAPMGVGYAFQSLPGAVASLSIDACPCGVSRLAPGTGIRGPIVDGSIPLPVVDGDIPAADVESSLRCEMRSGCTGEVTHIGSRGYVYCAACAPVRRAGGSERVRKMSAREVRMIREGVPLPKY